MNFRSHEIEATHTNTETIEIDLDGLDKDLKQIVEVLENGGVNMDRFHVTGYDEYTKTLTLTRITTTKFDKAALLDEVSFTHKQGQWISSDSLNKAAAKSFSADWEY